MKKHAFGIITLVFVFMESYAQTALEHFETFKPGLICTDSIEFNSVFPKDNRSFLFSRRVNKTTQLFISVKKGAQWTTPEPVPISMEGYSDADPAFSPSGELYFISDRPVDKSDTTKDFDIWKVKRLGINSWSQPENVKPLNSEKDEFYISFTKSGDACFSSSRGGGFGEEDIYISRYRNNMFSIPQNLGSQINSPNSEYDPFITPNGNAIIFVSSGREDSLGKADLYWSTQHDGNWLPVQHFNIGINTPSRDYCPYITSDNKQFFYSSHGGIRFLSTAHFPEALRVIIMK